MATYVQAQGSDTWHWCRNCSHYPRRIAKRRATRPSSHLCSRCRGMQRNGTCSS
jgi:hypothetical protein